MWNYSHVELSSSSFSSATRELKWYNMEPRKLCLSTFVICSPRKVVWMRLIKSRDRQRLFFGCDKRDGGKGENRSNTRLWFLLQIATDNGNSSFSSLHGELLRRTNRRRSFTAAPVKIVVLVVLVSTFTGVLHIQSCCTFHCRDRNCRIVVTVLLLLLFSCCLMVVTQFSNKI